MPDAHAPRKRSGKRPGSRLGAGRLKRLARRSEVEQPSRAVPKVHIARLVPSPVFVLSSERSGSTLLRALLDSHSQIHAPHELHLRGLAVDIPVLARRAMADLGLQGRDLDDILWDRVLHIRLLASGKQLIVDKTPHNVHSWRRIKHAWPDAKYLLLYRHPQRVFESWYKARPNDDPSKLAGRVTRNMTDLVDAAKHVSGLEIRYERLTHEPVVVTREICEYLGVPWEPRMLEYGTQDSERSFEKGLGDWSENIRSGQIRPDKPLPTRDEIAPDLLDATALTGYPV